MANHPDPQDLPELIQQYIKNLAQRIRNRYMRRDVISELSAHFTYCTAKASCTTIGDCLIQAGLVCLEQHVEHFLFRYWVADLDCVGKDCFVLVGYFAA